MKIVTNYFTKTGIIVIVAIHANSIFNRNTLDALLFFRVLRNSFSSVAGIAARRHRNFPKKDQRRRQAFLFFGFPKGGDVETTKPETPLGEGGLREHTMDGT